SGLSCLIHRFVLRARQVYRGYCGRHRRRGWRWRRWWERADFVDFSTLKMPACIESCSWNVAHIAVKIKALRIAKLRIRNRCCFCGPVRRDEASQRVRIVARAKVVEAGFEIAFFAGEFIVVQS